MTYRPDRDLVIQLIEAAGTMPPPGDLFLPVIQRIDELERLLAEARELMCTVILAGAIGADIEIDSPITERIKAWNAAIRALRAADKKDVPGDRLGSNQTYMSDPTWNNANNTIEVVGAGGSGGRER